MMNEFLKWAIKWRNYGDECYFRRGKYLTFVGIAPYVKYVKITKWPIYALVLKCSRCGFTTL